MAEELERRIEFYPAGEDTEYQRGDGRWRGIWSVDMAFYVIGPDGAAQFKVITGWDLPEVIARSNPGIPDYKVTIRQPLPADLGYHRRTPAYEGQAAMTGECHLIGGECFYDGSGLAAEEVFATLVREGSDGVWRDLEAYYADRVADPIVPVPA